MHIDSETSQTTVPTNRSPELEMLYRSARSVPAQNLVERRKGLVTTNFDWNRFVQLAEMHRVLPLVYLSLSKLELQIPPEVESKLNQASLANSQASLALTRELIRIVNIFSEQNITVMQIKGPTLAQSVYGDLALRSAGDLDIVVKAPDEKSAIAILLANTYSIPLYPGGKVGTNVHVGHYVESRRTGHIEAFSVDGIMLEVHRELGISYLPFGLNNSEIWDKAKPCQIFGREMYALPPVYQLLHLIHHGSKHGWYCLSWVCDINEFIRTKGDQIDWTELFRIAGRFKMLLNTQAALTLAKRILCCELSDAVQSNINSDQKIDLLCNMVTKMHESILEPHSYEHYQHRYRLAAMDNSTDGTSYIFRRAVTPTLADWKWLSLPKSLAGMYYLLRPIRLAGMLVRNFVQKLKPERPKA